MTNCNKSNKESLNINPEIEVDNTADLGITAVSCILMEASTGKVIYEKNADQALQKINRKHICTAESSFSY